MITLITGTPGAGKTLYAISKLILPVVGSQVSRTFDDGTVEHLPRTIYTNINGLLVDHELIGPGGDWEQGKDKEWQLKPIGEGQGLRDWHQWAAPGSIIVYDEFQRVWPPRPNGAAVPPDLGALDTHRHMGVDFVLITQSPNNHDRHVQGLVGRHLHVRRFGNSGLTVVYEWDHCSRQLLYSKSIAKSPWRYDKKVFKLYKSAEVHTKSPRRLPALFLFIAAGIGASLYLIPSTYQRIAKHSESTAAIAQNKDGKTVELSTNSLSPKELPKGFQASDYDSTQFIPRISNQPNTAPAYDELRKVQNMPRIAGGICSTTRCQCVTEQGTDVGFSSNDCRDWIKNRPYDAYTAQPVPVSTPVPAITSASAPASIPVAEKSSTRSST